MLNLLKSVIYRSERISSIVFASLVIFIPQVTSANIFGDFGHLANRAECLALQLSGESGGITCLLVKLQSFINQLLPFFAGLALVGLFYGLVQYVFKAGNEESRKQAKQVIIAGIVALFLMAAIGGIVNFLVEATGVDGGFFGRDNSFSPPTIDTGGSSDF